MLMLRVAAVSLVVLAATVAQAADFSGPSENGCLVQHSTAWCLMAVKGFGNQLNDVPLPASETTSAASADLDGSRAVGQGVQAAALAVDARAAAGLMSGVTRAMGATWMVLDLLTYQDPSMPLRGFKMLVWMPKDFPKDDTPKAALEKLLVQAMVTGTGSTGAEPVEFKWEALFKTDIVHYYKLVGEGRHQGKHFVSRVWQYNNGLSWSEDRAPEYLGGAGAYTFDLDIVPRFSTVEKKPVLNFDLGVIKAMSAALPPWVIVYVPPLNNKNPYLLQEGNVLAFETPASGKTP